MVPGDPRILPRRRLSSRFLTEGGVPFTMTRVNIIKGLGPVLQIAEGWSIELPKEMHDQLDARTNSTWPTTWFAPRLTGKGPFTDVYSVMANWGKPRRTDHRPRRLRLHHPGINATYSGLHA
jgi:L-fucose isomerase